MAVVVEKAHHFRSDRVTFVAVAPPRDGIAALPVVLVAGRGRAVGDGLVPGLVGGGPVIKHVHVHGGRRPSEGVTDGVRGPSVKALERLEPVEASVEARLDLLHVLHESVVHLDAVVRTCRGCDPSPRGP